MRPVRRRRPRSSALEIAADVRSGALAAADVVEAYLAAIDGVDGELHAFVTVLHDEARAEASEIDRRVGVRRGPRGARRCARGGEGQHVHAGRAHHVLVADPRAAGGRRTTPRWSSASAPRGPSSSARRTSTSSPWGPLPRTPPSAPRAIPTIHVASPVGRREGRPRRWRPAWRRWRWARTRAGRSANPPPCAAWWASSPPTAPCRATGSWPSPARSTRSGPIAGSVADCAALFDVIGGHDPM